MEKEQIEKIKELLKNSPIRKANKSTNGEFLHEEGILLENVASILENLKGEGPKPVNVVIMGEIKSGKSTFVNALMGKEVSKMDVLEATSTIYEMSYDDHICYDIHFADGRVQSVFEENEAVNLLEKASNPGKTQQEILKVQVHMPMEILKKVQIVDTPGLHTITTENMKVTEDYMVNADAVLWVLNIHHTGQRDVTDEIIKYRSYGKPFIALVNRVDEVDEDIEEVMNYLNEEMGYLFTKIIPISAKTSWRGVVENSDQKMREGRVQDVLTFLQERIADRSTQFIGEATVQTVKTQLAREIEVHKNSEMKMKQTMEKMSSQLMGIEENNRKIKYMMSNRAERIFSVNRTLYESGITKDNRILEAHIENSYREISERISQEWVQYCELMVESEEKLLIEKSQIDGVVNLSVIDSQTYNPTQKRVPNNNIFKMSLATLVSTAALSLALAPPLLIGGVFVGGLILTSNLPGDAVYDDNTSSVEGNAYHQVKMIMETAKQEYLSDIVESLESFSDRYCGKVKEIISSYYFGDELSYKTLMKLREDINTYVDKINSVNLIN